MLKEHQALSSIIFSSLVIKSFRAGSFLCSLFGPEWKTPPIFHTYIYFEVNIITQMICIFQQPTVFRLAACLYTSWCFLQNH